MENNPRMLLVNRLFAGTGRSYDLIVKLCTFGLDPVWKKKILDHITGEPNRILDQASGTGILTFMIARRFPLAHVTGVELREEYLDIALAKALRLGIGNADFRLGRAEDVILNGPFDCITSSYLAKYAELERLVRHAREMLRCGGTLILHDFTYPRGIIFPRAWKIYFRFLQSLGSRKYPEWRNAFYELPGFLRKTEWVNDLTASLRKNAFRNIQVKRLTFGASTVVSAEKPPSIPATRSR